MYNIAYCERITSDRCARALRNFAVLVIMSSFSPDMRDFTLFEISDLRRGAANEPQSNKVYRDVRILSVLSDRKGNSSVLHKIQFSTRGLQNVRWQNSKRLMFGNLLCFSSDMFQVLTVRYKHSELCLLIKMICFIE